MRISGFQSMAAIAALALGLVLLAFSADRAVVSYDAFWHLKMGEDWVSQGLSPWVDHYSFVYEGAPISSPPVAFQAAFFGLVDSFGFERGVWLLRFLAFAATLLALFVSARHYRHGRWVFLVFVPFVIVLMQFRMMCRPEIFTYAMIPIAFVLADRARRNFSVRNLGLIAAFLLIWVNYHNPIIGYVIFFGLFVDVGLSNLKGQVAASWKSWLGWGCVLVLLGFAKPGMHHFLIDQWNWNSGWNVYILEYLSAQETLGHSSFMKVYWMVAFSLLGYTLYKKEVGSFLIALILFAGAWNMVRLVPAAGIAGACIAIKLAGNEDWAAAASTINRLSKTLAFGLLAGVFLWSLSMSLFLLRAFAEERVNIEIFPTDVIEFMSQNERDGRVFNEFETGGYLIYHRAPENQVFIDGRTVILYPFAYYENYLQIAQNRRYARQASVDFDFDYVLFVSDEQRYRMWREFGFNLDFLGRDFFLLAREDAALSKAGDVLMDAYCWNGRANPAVLSEIQRLLQNVDKESTAFRNLKFYADLIGSGDVGAFQHHAQQISGDIALRLAAKASELQGDFASSRQFLEKIKQKRTVDLLSLAHKYLATGDFDQAEISLIAAIQRASLDEQAKAVVIGLRDALAQQSSLRSSPLRELETNINSTPYDATALCDLDGGAKLEDR